MRVVLTALLAVALLVAAVGGSLLGGWEWALPPFVRGARHQRLYGRLVGGLYVAAGVVVAVLCVRLLWRGPW